MRYLQSPALQLRELRRKGPFDHDVCHAVTRSHILEHMAELCFAAFAPLILQVPCVLPLNLGILAMAECARCAELACDYCAR